ncbi:hypothetical protein F8144_19440 [Streptomyces triticiradicis]|uniref:Uncharacterized protein n=1 Tax=Streptomyces triticiradicis TaxID=2651189 RepID=A0A7J5DEV7_9ACTN|nr:hypothetical protein F8144_19440 [Streptomyces triticiradicis]
MVTTRSPWRAIRIRSTAGPWAYVPTLVVLLFSVFVTHAVHVESADGHLSTSAAASAVLPGGDVRRAAVEAAPRSAADAGERHGAHESAHPGDHCASGRLQQGPARAVPRFAASIRESASADTASVVRVTATDRRMEGAPPAALRVASVVRQV